MAVYPFGTSAPSAINAAPTRIYRGWPSEAQLDADLSRGIVNISVFPKVGYTRNTTRMARQWIDGPITLPTMSTTIFGDTVTISGLPGVTQNVGIRTREGAWAVTASPTEDAPTVAAALRALIPGASGSGADVVMPTTDGLVALTGGTGGASMEVRRQTQGFQVTIWAPTPALRDVAASTVDLLMAQTDWLVLADGSQVWLTYDTSTVVDEPSKDNLWRRDLMYTVEYPTTLNQTAAQMLFGGGLLEGPNTAWITVYGDVHPDLRSRVNVS